MKSQVKKSAAKSLSVIANTTPAKPVEGELVVIPMTKVKTESYAADFSLTPVQAFGDEITPKVILECIDIQHKSKAAAAVLGDMIKDGKKRPLFLSIVNDLEKQAVTDASALPAVEKVRQFIKNHVQRTGGRYQIANATLKIKDGLWVEAKRSKAIVKRVENKPATPATATTSTATPATATPAKPSTVNAPDTTGGKVAANATYSKECKAWAEKFISEKLVDEPNGNLLALIDLLIARTISKAA